AAESQASPAPPGMAGADGPRAHYQAAVSAYTHAVQSALLDQLPLPAAGLAPTFSALAQSALRQYYDGILALFPPAGEAVKEIAVYYQKLHERIMELEKQVLLKNDEKGKESCTQLLQGVKESLSSAAQLQLKDYFTE